MLSAEQLNAFMHDPHTHRTWFNTRASVVEPMNWWRKGHFAVEEKFEADDLCIIVSGEKRLQFKAQDELPACRISKVALTPMVGGFTQLDFTLQLRPGIGKTNLILQEHQNREIKISIADAKLAARKNGQRDLPLGAASTTTRDEDDNDGAIGRAQVEAFERGRPAASAEQP